MQLPRTMKHRIILNTSLIFGVFCSIVLAKMFHYLFKCCFSISNMSLVLHGKILPICVLSQQCNHFGKKTNLDRVHSYVNFSLIFCLIYQLLNSKIFSTPVEVRDLFLVFQESPMITLRPEIHCLGRFDSREEN